MTDAAKSSWRKKLILAVTAGTAIAPDLISSMELDYEVTPGCGPIDALLNTYAPDILILDLDLPGEKAFDACRLARAHSVGRSIPILFLADRHDDPTFLRALASGADAVLPKPVQPAVLLVRLAALLASYRLPGAL